MSQTSTVFLEYLLKLLEPFFSAAYLEGGQKRPVLYLIDFYNLVSRLGLFYSTDYKSQIEGIVRYVQEYHIRKRGANSKCIIIIVGKNRDSSTETPEQTKSMYEHKIAINMVIQTQMPEVICIDALAKGDQSDKIIKARDDMLLNILYMSLSRILCPVVILSYDKYNDREKYLEIPPISIYIQHSSTCIKIVQFSGYDDFKKELPNAMQYFTKTFPYLEYTSCANGNMPCRCKKFVCVYCGTCFNPTCELYKTTQSDLGFTEVKSRHSHSRPSSPSKSHCSSSSPSESHSRSSSPPKSHSRSSSIHSTPSKNASDTRNSTRYQSSRILTFDSIPMDDGDD
jgi:hypothetical protein